MFWLLIITLFRTFSFQGVVVDSNQQPIVGAVVVLQARQQHYDLFDSVQVVVEEIEAITDSQGRFSINKEVKHIGLLASWIEPVVIVFKAGYGCYPRNAQKRGSTYILPRLEQSEITDNLDQLPLTDNTPLLDAEKTRERKSLGK